MTLANAILAAHTVGRASGAGAAWGPAASAQHYTGSNVQSAAAHSADDTVHQPSDRQVSSARAGDQGHRRKSERVTIKPSKHQRSSSCE